MHQLLLAFSYNGSAFHGTQMQPGLPTASQALAQRLQHAFAPQRLRAWSVSSRLDAGVHARVNFASCRMRLTSALPESRWQHACEIFEQKRQDGLNQVALYALSHRLMARAIDTVKHYRYTLRSALTAPQACCASFGDAWHTTYLLDTQIMRQAAQLLIGTHCFDAFVSLRAKEKFAPPIYKSILAFEVHAKQCRCGAHYWQFDCITKSLRRKQMRRMVAALIQTGLRRCAPEAIVQALETRVWPLSESLFMPACGLTLMDVVAVDKHAPAVEHLRRRICEDASHTLLDDYCRQHHKGI